MRSIRLDGLSRPIRRVLYEWWDLGGEPFAAEHLNWKDADFAADADHKIDKKSCFKERSQTPKVLADANFVLGLGAAAVISLLFALHHYQRWRFLNNWNANFSAPGLIPYGNFTRFTHGIDRLFPNSPAQSYISLYAYSLNIYHVEETKFFIRSVGKRDGKHSFRGELRLSEKDRHHIIDALPMLERIGAPIEREDKSYGLVVLKTSKLESASELIEVASEFSKRVLMCSESDPLTISWHVAGYHGAQKPNECR